MPDQPRQRTETSRQISSGWDRRAVLTQGLALTGAVFAGCTHEPQPAASIVESSNSRVPLRVLLVGDSASADSLQRAWSATDDAELAIDAIAIARSESKRLREEAMSRASKSDVLIFPLLLAGDLFTEQQIIELDLNSLTGAGQSERDGGASAMPPALRTGLARFADQTVALPLGGIIPAVFSVDPIEPAKTWSDYDALVAGTWRGAASEPTSPGWAGAMYLWRAMSAAREGWLFDRDSFDPLVATEPYMETLEQMIQTHSRYAAPRQRPGEIWDSLQQGTMRGGITFPSGDTDAFPDIQVFDMPSGDSIQRVLFDPLTPIASISAACRQSALAKRFLAWLANSEGNTAIGRSISGVKQVLSPVQSEAESSSERSPYARWLQQVWKTPLSSPGLQLIRGGEYYQILDREIGKALDAESKPAESLRSVAAQWRALSKQVGVDTQLRVWHQSQGRRG